MKKYNRAFCVREVAGTKKEITIDTPDLNKKEMDAYVRENHPDFVVRRVWVSKGPGVVADFMNPNIEAFV